MIIGSINPALYFNQLAGRKEVQFDWAKLQWLGSPDWSDHVLYMRTDTPYKTIRDVRTAAAPPKCTATATGTTGHYLPKLLEETIGTKFSIVLGYPGGPEIDLAVETCMMDVAPHHECSGTMAQTRAIVEGRHLDAGGDIHSPGL